MPALSAFAAELDALASMQVRLGSRNPEHPVEDLSELRFAMKRLADKARGMGQTEAVKTPTGEIVPGVRIIGKNQVIVCRTGRPPKPANDDVHAAARAAFKVV